MPAFASAVIPAKAGIHVSNTQSADEWIPAFAGMTTVGFGTTVVGIGMTAVEFGMTAVGLEMTTVEKR